MTAWIAFAADIELIKIDAEGEEANIIAEAPFFYDAHAAGPI